MKFPTRFLQVLTKSLALCACLASAATAQTFSSPPPEIVSAWKHATENLIVVFHHDGSFYLVDGEVGHPGMERGTFTWNKSTQAFEADVVIDTNGDAGFSPPEGLTTISISGNTLSYTIASEGTFTFTRVINTASAIVGSWYVPGKQLTGSFLSDGTYYQTAETNDVPFAYDGIERGTYTWNSTTKVFTATPILDTNGDDGLNNLPIGFTMTVSGNSLVASDGTNTTTLRRITPVASPLSTMVNFEVDKFANYRQTSNASPALLTGSPTDTSDDFPYTGEAFIEPSVSGTAGTLAITGKPAFNFVDAGGWEIATKYTTLTALNTAFPNGANYVFARTGGSATLSYPAGGTFQAAPMIQIGEGAWSGGKYLLGSGQTITWSPISGYDPASLVTVISVVDVTNYEEIFYEDVIPGDVTSYNLSGKLEPGHNYEVQIEHIKIASSTTSGTGPFSGKLGYALYNSNTRVVMVAPSAPEPPAISEQPVSQAGIPGSPLFLQVGINEEAFGASTFQWFRNGQIIPGQSGNSLYIPSFDPEIHSGQYLVSVSNAEGNDISEIAILVAPDPYDVYIAGIGLDPQAAGAPEFDHDNDGYSNLFEFVVGGDPKLAQANLLPPPVFTPVAGGAHLVFKYNRRTVAADVAQVVEYSSTLAPPWIPAIQGVAGVTLSVSAPVSGVEQVTVNVPLLGSKNFARLRVGPEQVINLETSYANFKQIGLTSQTLPSELAHANTRGYGDFFNDGTTGLFSATLQYSTSLPAGAAIPSSFAFWRKKIDGTYVKNDSMIPGGDIGSIHPRKALVADFNKDGRPDVFVISHGYDAAPFPGERNKIVLSQPNGTYAIQDASPDVAFFHGGAAADVDKDGDIDVMVVRGGGIQATYLNQGNGTFVREISSRLPAFISNKGYYSLDLLDLNEDGLPDLMVGGHEFEEAPTQVYINPGGFRFAGVAPITIPSVANEGVVLDFVATGAGASRALWVLRTSGGDGTFYEGRTIQKVTWPGLISTTPLKTRLQDWVDWIIPSSMGGRPAIICDDASRNLSIPQ